MAITLTKAIRDLRGRAGDFAGLPETRLANPAGDEVGS